jgi:hypothetical protein
MSIDRTDWHTDTLPEGVPEDAAGTHIGMFLAWAILNRRMAAAYEEQNKAMLDKVRARTMTGPQYLLTERDGKLIEGDLDPDTLAFAQQCYGKHYFSDYERAVAANLPSIFHVADTWENYDKVAAVIDERFAKWRSRGDKRWWQFWK